MEFAPEITSKIHVEGNNYQFGEHPASPNMPYGQEGRASMVYQIVSDKDKRALKVFKQQYRRPSLVSLAEKLSEFASIPGLTVCQRTVLTPAQHQTLLRQHKDLVYSVIMPWIDGPTWFDILVDKRPLTKSQCLIMAKGLCQTLMSMEQKGLAHCDLSGPNMIFPCLLDGSTTSSAYPMELVDVEGIYHSQLPRPEILVSGTYPHKENIKSGVGEWSDQADRFAGSVLLAEILGWCDQRTRDYICRRGKDTFFSEKELQIHNEGFDVLLTSVRENWGSGVSDLFERAWNSDSLAQCPTFGEWSLVLPTEVTPPATSIGEMGSHIPQQLGQGGSNTEQTLQVLMDLAQRLNEQGNYVGAIAAYNQVLAMTSPGSTLHSAVEMLIRTIESNSTRNKPPLELETPTGKPTAYRKLEPLDLSNELPKGEWRPVIPERSSRNRDLMIASGVFVVVALFLAIGVLIFGRSLGHILGQTISSTGFALSIGLIQTWLFRKRLRKNKRFLFILPALIAGIISGIGGGLLLANKIITSSIVGGVMGIFAGGLTAFGQNYLMRSHSTTKIWLAWNMISWGVIWAIGWAMSWNIRGPFSANAASALAAITIMALTGISLSVFLHYSPEIEF